MLTQEAKRHATIIAIHASHSDLEITIFLNVVRSFVHEVRIELEDSAENPSSLSKTKLFKIFGHYKDIAFHPTVSKYY